MSCSTIQRCRYQISKWDNNRPCQDRRVPRVYFSHEDTCSRCNGCASRQNIDFVNIHLNLYLDLLLTLGRPQYEYIRPESQVQPHVVFPYFTPSLLYRFLVQHIQRAVPSLRPKRPIYTDPWITPIQGMLSEIKSAIQTVEHPITHNLVILSYPDFEADTGHIHLAILQIACEQAGLEEFAAVSQLSSRAALGYYQIRDCDDDDVPDPYCHGLPEERIDTVLAINYNGVSLGTTLLTRWLGMLFPVRVGEHFNHGADTLLRHDNPTKYWEEVKAFMEEAIKDEKVDHLMLLGSHATDNDLLGAVREIFEVHGYGTTWQKYLAKFDTAGSEEHLFAAARGAARVARNGMIDGFDACWVPETCPKPDDEDVNTFTANGTPEL